MPHLFLLPAGKGKRVVLWTLVFFAAGQVAVWTWLDRCRPELHDPLYGYRLLSLRDRLAQSPGAPLVLFLGSSRSKYGIRPAAMHVAPVVYNFGINGLGSIRSLIYLRRLLADGIRPDWLFVETWPPQWSQKGFVEEAPLWLGNDELHWGDVPLAWRYFRDTPEILKRGLHKNLVPVQGYRLYLTEAVAPCLLSHQQLKGMAVGRLDLDPPSPDGWFPLTYGAQTPQEIECSLNRGRDELKPLLDPVRIDPRNAAALRELLGECRANGIKAVVYLLPEPGVTRGWYTPQSRTLVQSYLAGLSREYEVPVIDTREWLPDKDFTDCCHMWDSAAGPFSDRFAREVLGPLLEGKSPSGEVSPHVPAAAMP
jgi:hypothetical protein